MLDNDYPCQNKIFPRLKSEIYYAYFKWFFCRKEKFYDSINNIIKNEVKDFNKRDELIQLFFNKFNFHNYLENFVLNWGKKNIDQTKKMIHKNILVIGEEGVGKSALINSFLKITRAEEGIGEGVTDNFYSYTSEPDNSFKLIDSKGIKQESSDIEIDRIIDCTKERQGV